MRRRYIVLGALAALAAATVYVVAEQDASRDRADAVASADVVIDTPQSGDLVSSPLTVKGRARGFWFFEATLPVALKDQSGAALVRQAAQARGEWMTEDYVEFEVVLEFAAPSAEAGELVIEKDNPSGLPANDASFAVPVRFR